ncbi:uncharacterized protein K444DRAFT_406533 [Hyaloscypha bicolor E]|uniref:Uncharacterized protein n=1 Tax=Hyaloscypha bicolor E TaxID=1095630 RepID=A0A2J6T9B2_9HELO|nr:uncharacterized protein K444DRAFT_406533 [Hyaloscypha bicolor E]PMD59595.1 hypothetical protein K444DRAFT_406533 [Hyaloscypha bicolor E]
MPKAPYSNQKGNGLAALGVSRPGGSQLYELERPNHLCYQNCIFNHCHEPQAPPPPRWKSDTPQLGGNFIGRSGLEPCGTGSMNDQVGYEIEYPSAYILETQAPL